MNNIFFVLTTTTICCSTFAQWQNNGAYNRVTTRNPGSYDPNKYNNWNNRATKGMYMTNNGNYNYNNRKPIMPAAIFTSTIETGNPQSHPNFKLFKNDHCGIVSTNRISFGERADLNEFPWVALLGYREGNQLRFNCDGSLITELFVLTAAHCLLEPQKLIRVRLGENDLSKQEDCEDGSDEYDEDRLCAGLIQDVNVAAVIPHKNFNRRTIVNDIGLVRLAERANTNQNNIRTICLPFTPELDKLPSKLTVVGYGRTHNADFSTVLLKAHIPLYDINQCREKYASNRNFVLTDKQFCAGGEGKVDACKGDSGGPIQFTGLVNGKSRLVIYGIVSFGADSCGKLVGYPGIYTKTSKYIDWIVENVSQ